MKKKPKNLIGKKDIREVKKKKCQLKQAESTELNHAAMGFLYRDERGVAVMKGSCSS